MFKSELRLPVFILVFITTLFSSLVGQDQYEAGGTIKFRDEVFDIGDRLSLSKDLYIMSNDNTNALAIRADNILAILNTKAEEFVHEYYKVHMLFRDGKDSYKMLLRMYEDEELKNYTYYSIIEFYDAEEGGVALDFWVPEDNAGFKGKLTSIDEIEPVIGSRNRTLLVSGSMRTLRDNYLDLLDGLNIDDAFKNLPQTIAKGLARGGGIEIDDYTVRKESGWSTINNSACVGPGKGESYKKINVLQIMKRDGLDGDYHLARSYEVINIRSCGSPESFSIYSEGKLLGSYDTYSSALSEITY